MLKCIENKTKLKPKKWGYLDIYLKYTIMS